MTMVDSGGSIIASLRGRVAVALVALQGVALLVTGVVGIGTLRTYQVVLNIVAFLVLLLVAARLIRGRDRVWAVVVCYLSAFGVIAECGDYQARMNETEALGATNTTYFLPPLVWLLMFGLLAVAVAVTALSKPSNHDT